MESEQEWIESPNGWGEEAETYAQDEGSLDLFADHRDPREYFEFRVQAVNGTMTTLKLAGFQLDSDETAKSTGVTLWQAAPRLAKFLQQADDIIAGRTILELGAGLGLCGIVAHCRGAQSVVLTDGDTQTLRQMRENVQNNCGEASPAAIDCRQLIWGSLSAEKFQRTYGTFDTILGADVIYTKASTDPLFHTVACLLQKPLGRFVLSRYNKWNNVSDEIILEAAKARNLECTQPAEGIFVFHWKETTDPGDKDLIDPA